jgi:O-methyltransferase
MRRRGQELVLMTRATRLHRKYAERSIVPRKRFTHNVLLANRVVDVPGAVVECGTWRGGMIAALAEVLHAGPDREFVLFDSFEGLPPASDIDGERAMEWQRSIARSHLDNLNADVTEAQTSMRMANVDARVVKGWFDETVPTYAAERPRIALLRLDGDWYDSTMTCLVHLFPLVVSGGMVIIDDYESFDGCTRAVHDYLSQTDATDRIRNTTVGVTYLIRS